MELQGSERFGQHLRRLRERRRLSLDRVEELSTNHMERITRSHLSRIENGQALPTLPRLITLSRLYGEKLGDLVERLEFDLQVENGAPVDVTNRTPEELEAEAKLEADRGELARALQLLEAAGDRVALEQESTPSPAAQLNTRLKLSTVLLRSGKLTLAAEYAQSVLATAEVPLGTKLWALMNLAVVYRKQGKLVLCRILVESVLAHGNEVPRYHMADANMLLGGLAYLRGDLEEACQHYSDSTSLYRDIARPFEESKALKGLSKCYLKKGQLTHASRFIDQQLSLVRAHGFQVEEGWGLQVKAIILMEGDDLLTANSLLRQSNEIARRLNHTELLFTNHFHQLTAARAAGDQALATSIARILRRLRTLVEEDLSEVRAYDAEVREDER